MEIWKFIPNCDGRYAVSNHGRIKSYYAKKGKILHSIDNGNGYKFVNLMVRGKRIHSYVHRLVADAFIPKKCGCLEVNHKDENKSNNTSDNLEWCNHLYNTRYGTRNIRLGKRVDQFTKDGLKVREWETLTAIEKELGFDKSRICAVCNGRLESAYGYVWKHAA